MAHILSWQSGCYLEVTGFGVLRYSESSGHGGRGTEVRALSGRAEVVDAEPLLTHCWVVRHCDYGSGEGVVSPGNLCGVRLLSIGLRDDDDGLVGQPGRVLVPLS